MNGLEVTGVVLLSLFTGFQVGSIVEYKKKYNFFDLELDKYHAVTDRLHGLVQTLLSHVQHPFTSGSTATLKGSQVPSETSKG